MPIAERKCPACQGELKRFQFSAIFTPLESRLNDYRALYGNIHFPCFPSGVIKGTEVYRFCFTSVCKECGHISFWHISADEIDEIISKSSEEHGKGVALDWIYKPQDFKELLDSFDDKENSRYKAYLRIYEWLSEIWEGYEQHKS